MRPTSIYAVSKQSQEQAALVVGAARALPVIALRYFNVYGSRQSLSNPYTGVIPAFVGRALNGQPPEVYEDGHESRDFVHVSDVVRATLLAIDDRVETDPRVVNVGSGMTQSLLDVACAVTAALDGPEPVVTGKFRVGDVRHCHADLTHVRAALGFEPTVSFADGIIELANDLADKLHEDHSARAEAELSSRGLAARAK
jgi:dTDP-L-rhamnose 4-epimerase